MSACGNEPTPRERAAAFLASLPAPDETPDECVRIANREVYEQVMAPNPRNAEGVS